MRIVSLNAWGGAMFHELREWLPGCGADVLCLQEVSRTPALDGWTSFRDGERELPQRANLFRDICELLPRHQGSFVVSDSGPVVDDRGNVHRQDFGLALFVGDSWPVVGQLADHVHGVFIDHVQWPIADRPRVAHGVRVVDRAGQRTIAVVHLHGLRDPSGKGDTPLRSQQARRLVDAVDRLRADGDLIVVCGDLNLLPESETFTTLSELGLVDLVGPADTRTTQYKKPLRHASYMLVSDVSAVAHFEAPANPEVSDHRPLILDL